MPLFRRTPRPQPEPEPLAAVTGHGPHASRQDPRVARALGQTALIHSDRLPVDTHGTDSEFEALGFRFDEPDADDPVFRRAHTPSGWTREAGIGREWSYLLDREKRRRAAVFYDADPGHRAARMHLVTVAGYLDDCMARGRPLHIDGEWCTNRGLTDLLDERIAATGEELAHGIGGTHHRSLALRKEYRHLINEIRRGW